MGKITCYDISGAQLTNLYQWDSNRVVVISGVDPGIVTEVHFCNIDSEEALVASPRVSGNDVTATIPNILLQKAKPILVYVFSHSDSSESRTVESTRIVVTARPKPANYVYYETEVFSYSTINKRLLDLEESVSGMVKSVNGATPDEDGNVDTRPDWNENDETAPGYIKNRPFYDILTVAETVTEEEQVTCAGDTIPAVATTTIVEKDYIYKVIFDSVEYICKGAHTSGHTKYIGNGNRCLTDEDATNEPFCLMFSQTGYWNGVLYIYADDGEHTVQVFRMESNPAKLDDKFLPNTIARTPDWNQHDSTSPSYIKNRPFYACYDRGPGDTYVDNMSFTITNEGGSATIRTNFGTTPAIGQSFYIVFDKTDYDCQTVEEVILSDGSIECGMGNKSLRNPELENNGLPFYICCTYWGFYVFFVYAEPGEHTIQIRKDKYEIKKIDETFIPDTIVRKYELESITNSDWNAGANESGYIENRTHYEEQITEVIYEGVLPSSLDGGSDSFLNGPGYFYTPLCTVNEMLTCGKVSINGVVHEFVTGEYFTVIGGRSMIAIICHYTGDSYEVRFASTILDSDVYSSKIQVSKQNTVVHQLDEEYIPDTIARKTDIPEVTGDAKVGQYFRVAAVDETGTVTAVETVDAPKAGSGGPAVPKLVKSITITEDVTAVTESLADLTLTNYRIHLFMPNTPDATAPSGNSFRMYLVVGGNRRWVMYNLGRNYGHATDAIFDVLHCADNKQFIKTVQTREAIGVSLGIAAHRHYGENIVDCMAESPTEIYVDSGAHLNGLVINVYDLG